MQISYFHNIYLRNRVTLNVIPTIPSACQGGGPQFKYVYFGGHSLKRFENPWYRALTNSSTRGFEIHSYDFLSSQCDVCFLFSLHLQTFPSLDPANRPAHSLSELLLLVWMCHMTWLLLTKTSQTERNRPMKSMQCGGGARLTFENQQKQWREGWLRGSPEFLIAPFELQKGSELQSLIEPYKCRIAR